MRKPQKINNLQILRGLAAIAVVFYHTDCRIEGLYRVGSFGVDTFFVISGYIMALICTEKPKFFLRRRIIRIVPPYWFLTIVLYFVALLDPALLGDTRASIPALLKSLFFIPFYKTPGKIQPLLFLGWTLNYEMFFYLAIAAVLFFTRKRPMLLVTALLISWAILCHAIPGQHAFFRFFNGWQILEFPMGALAYEIVRRCREDLSLPAKIACVAVAVFAGVVLVEAQMGFRPPRPLAWIVFGTASFFLVCCASLLSKAGWDSKWKWLILVGDSSYILYLVHPYCVLFIDRIVARRVHWLVISRPIGSLIAITVTTLVAIVLHLKGEVPLINFLNRRYGGHRLSTEFKTAA